MATVILETTNLVRRFGKADERPAVDGVSFSVAPGEVLAIVGVNGAGKTTLLRMCATLLTPTAGNIIINGVNAVAAPYQARKHLGLSFGGSRGFHMTVSVRRNLRYFASLAGVPRHQLTAEVERVLTLTKLVEKAEQKASSLSRGQFQRLHIARALLGSPPLVILDEPTSGLDPDVALEVRSLVAGIARSGTAVVLASHSMEEVSEIANSILLMKRGQVACRGTLQEVLASSAATHTSVHAVNAATPLKVGKLAGLTHRIPRLLRTHLRAAGAHWLLTAWWNAAPTDAQLAALSVAALATPQHKHAVENHPGGTPAPHTPAAEVPATFAVPVVRPCTLEDVFLFLAAESEGV